MNGRRRDPEAGFDLIGTAIMVPAALLVLALIVGISRVSAATQTVEAAAAFAARAASLARTPGTATAAATATAERQLTAQGLVCATSSTTVDTAGFATRLGDPAQVSVTLTCTVPLSDLGLPGVPGSKVLQARAVSSLDSFRQRGGAS